MMKTIAVFISIFMLITGTACAAGLNLPPAAGICVGRAVALAEKGKTGQAIYLLEKFNSKKTGDRKSVV